MYRTEIKNIENLPRGQYLRRKADLIQEEHVRFYRSMLLPGSEVPKSLHSVNIPDAIRQFHRISDGTNGMSRWFPIVMAPYSDLQSVLQARRSIVEMDNLFPPVYLRLFPVGFFGGQLEVDVWAWSLGDDGEVIAHDTVERQFFIVANCLDNFFEQVAFCIQEDLEFNIVSPSRRLREFSLTQERQDGFESGRLNRKYFSFDNLRQFPAHWQAKLGPYDRSFRLE